MYLLIKKDDTCYKLNNGQSYVVGRKDCDINLEEKAVSKKHAKITIKNEVVYITDLKSSNKTNVNGINLKPNEETTVKVGFVITFGSPEATFTLKKDEIIITMSGLSKTDRELVMKIMKTLSGSVLANWSPTCTHIITNEMILTAKVLSALINKQPIVTIDYFKARLKNFQGKGDEPKPSDFRPPANKDNILKHKGPIDYSLDRRDLFKNKVFVFPHDASKKKIDEVIKLAGGKSISFQSKPLMTNQLLSQDVEYVFIITTDDTQSENSEFNDCIKFLKDHNRRSVPLSEIAMAIVTGDCKKECNPLFNKIAHLMSAEKSDVGGSMDVESQTQVRPERKEINSSMQCVPSSQSQMSQDEVVEVSPEKNTQGMNSSKNVPEKKVQAKINSFFKRNTQPSTSNIGSQKSSPVMESIVIDDSDDDSPMPSTSIKRKSADQEESSQKKQKLDSKQKVVDSQPKENIPEFTTSTQNSIPEKDPKRKANFDEDVISSKPKKTNTQKQPFNFSLDDNEDTTENRKDYSNNPFFSAATKKKVSLWKDKPSPQKTSNVGEPKANSPCLSKSNKQTSSLFNKRAVENSKLNNTEESVISKRKRSPSVATPNKKPFNETSNILTSTRIEDESVVNPISFSSHFENSNLCKWLSKDTPSISEKKSEELDVTVKAYVDDFKSATIEVISSSVLIVRKLQECSLNSTKDTTNNRTNSKSNFKKFKKATPLRPQTYIIPSSSYVMVMCGENSIQTVVDKNVEVLENVKQEDAWGEKQEDEEEENDANAFEFDFPH